MLHRLVLINNTHTLKIGYLGNEAKWSTCYNAHLITDSMFGQYRSYKIRLFECFSVVLFTNTDKKVVILLFALKICKCNDV